MFSMQSVVFEVKCVHGNGLSIVLRVGLIYFAAFVGCGYCCSGMYSGPLVPQAFRMRQVASSNIIFLVSFCISDDDGEFFNKKLAKVKHDFILSFFVGMHFP